MHLPKRLSILIAAFLAFAIIGLFYVTGAPKDFKKTVISVPQGQTLSEAARTLYENGVIKSELAFKIFARLLDSTGIKTGQYLFDKAEPVFSVASRLVRGELGFPLVKVTIPEGSSSRDVAAIVKRAIPEFDNKAFLPLAKEKEGYLFPETYFWPVNVSPDQVIASMNGQFVAEIEEIEADLAQFGKPEKDVISMASLVEREAKTSMDRRIVAGILWKRLGAGMPLQVDATFYYLLGKASEDLTIDDLGLKSPYNLYTNSGLPPTPIANPGIEAIRDTVLPTKTPYWYYLSDDNGTIHYASTLEEHASNKFKYLD